MHLLFFSTKPAELAFSSTVFKEVMVHGSQISQETPAQITFIFSLNKGCGENADLSLLQTVLIRFLRFHTQTLA